MEQSTGPKLSRVLIVGAGLIGTSLGMALRRTGVEVRLSDSNPAHADHARRLGAGMVGEPPAETTSAPELIVLAVPPASVPSELVRVQQLYPGAVCADVSSVHSGLRERAAELGADLSRFVSGHPMAGREISGPSGADAGLFYGRTWIVIDTAEPTDQARELVRRMIGLIGARPTVRTAPDHDRAMARVSHVPQLVASALAASLLQLTPDEVALAESGVRDTTRIAGSSADLWTGILSANAREVAEVIPTVIDDLANALSALRVLSDTSPRDEIALAQRGSAESTLAEILARGNAGRGRLGERHPSASGS